VFVQLPRLGHDMPPGVAMMLIDRIADFHGSTAVTRGGIHDGPATDAGV